MRRAARSPPACPPAARRGAQAGRRPTSRPRRVPHPSPRPAGRAPAGAYPASLDDYETERILATLLELGVNTFVCLQAEFALHTPESAWRAGQGLRPYIKDAQRILIRARETHSVRIKQVRRGEAAPVWCGLSSCRGRGVGQARNAAGRMTRRAEGMRCSRQLTASPCSLS